MPTIRDLVAAIRQREGVEAAVMLGRDGLLIDGQAQAGLDTENIAALVPSHRDGRRAICRWRSAGRPGHRRGRVFARPRVVSALTPDAVLLVLVQPVGPASGSCCSNCAATASTSRPWSEGVMAAYRILVADDEPHIGRIVKTKLEQGPFAVTLVQDGGAALAHWSPSRTWPW